jgi:hypothetical protein
MKITIYKNMLIYHRVDIYNNNIIKINYYYDNNKIVI